VLLQTRDATYWWAVVILTNAIDNNMHRGAHMGNIVKLVGIIAVLVFVLGIIIGHGLA
jgi:hypothetical protein